MNNQQAMKKFDSLMAKYDFDPRYGIDYRYQEAIELGDESVFSARIDCRSVFDYSLVKDDQDRPTAFGQVVLNCAQIMMLAMDYYKNLGNVANWSQTDAEDGGDVLEHFA